MLVLSLSLWCLHWAYPFAAGTELSFCSWYWAYPLVAYTEPILFCLHWAYPFAACTELSFCSWYWACPFTTGTEPIALLLVLSLFLNCLHWAYPFAARTESGGNEPIFMLLIHTAPILFQSVLSQPGAGGTVPNFCCLCVDCFSHLGIEPAIQLLVVIRLAWCCVPDRYFWC